MCKNMERENSHLCQHTPAQCMHSHTHTHTQTYTHTFTPSLFHCHEALCEDSDITTLCTTSAQEKLVGEMSLSSQRRENENITNSLLQG